MAEERWVNDLQALKEIAETLNGSHDLTPMLDQVLRKLLDVTGLQTGWIFLMDDEGDYRLVADRNLPPALTWGEKTPMCTDSCWCVSKYWNKRLHNAVNIINCKRIEDAVAHNWGDTAGIYYHATVALRAGDEWFGLLNVAAPGKTEFGDNELALLESVAYQIGTAIKRTKLYQVEQKRAEWYTRLGEISKLLGQENELNQIPLAAVEAISRHFSWPSVAYFGWDGEKLILRALAVDGTAEARWGELRAEPKEPLAAALRKRRITQTARLETPDDTLVPLGIPPFRSAVAVPILPRGELQALLLVSSPRRSGFDENDTEMLHTLADHLALSLENARVTKCRSEMIKWEERNRLARDLHDSVCQNLFSLSLMSRGLQSVLSGHELAQSSLAEIGKLTEESLKEMRALIWQLRPAGLELGLLTALAQYGERLGLKVQIRERQLTELPRFLEEALLRIGQEALNNAAKHAGTPDVQLTLEKKASFIHLVVTDYGKGFLPGRDGRPDSLGLTSMRERAEVLGGYVNVDSSPGKGTVVRAVLPLRSQSVWE